MGALKIDEFIANYKFAVRLQERLAETVKAKVRIYMLEGFNFAQKDLFSLSDPYLHIICGKETVNERENYQLDTTTPTFYKCYDFNVSFPGAPMLTIEAYDYDGFFGDDLIGITKLDLDDRFFNKEWCAIQNKPIEYRNLHHPTSTISQGVVKMWCEIHPVTSKKSERPPIDITPEPEYEYEGRLVIWKTEDIEMMDFEGTSDIFIRAFLDPADDHLTDTHWRCTDGVGSFNWRLIFKIKSGQDSYNLSVQAWDKDIIASNDLIGDFNLDISPLFEDVMLTNKKKSFNKKYWNDYMKQELIKRDFKNTKDVEWEDNEKFWIPMRRYDEETGEEKFAGKVQCSLRIYTTQEAEKEVQGVGRAEPNNDPFCPEPEGRIKLSLNPFEMFSQLIGPAVRRKIYMLLCCLACASLCVMMAPMIISNGFSTLLFG